MRRYIYSLMIDERDGAAAAVIKGVLWVISFFYCLSVDIIRVIRSTFAKRLPCTVISIGNLTLGGTGKTPAACMLAESLRDMGHKVSLLIRGYGDDEWRMLKSKLEGIFLIVGGDRYSSGMEAVSRYNVDTVILDDGFQHWGLKRDLDIVLIDSANPFGNRRCFPRGILREGIRGLRRAGVVVLTKTDLGRCGVRGIREELISTIPRTPILESVHKAVGAYNLFDKKEVPLDSLKERDICALSGIVNAGYFEYTLKGLGVNIVTAVHYPDHYNYKAHDIARIIGECKNKNVNIVVTTEKDAVKLERIWGGRFHNPVPADMLQVLVIKVELKVTDGEEILKRRLHNLYSGKDC